MYESKIFTKILRKNLKSISQKPKEKSKSFPNELPNSNLNFSYQKNLDDFDHPGLWEDFIQAKQLYPFD
jgi:hypothetical protein